MNIIPEFEYFLMSALENRRLQSGIAPVYLGGSSGSGGGVGSPPGGYIGQLVQSKVTYDTDELSDTSGSTSLVDNLDRIRARLSTVYQFWNRSGGALVNGDVVVLDATQSESVKTTTTDSDTTVLGVYRESASSGSQGLVTLGGYAPVVNVNGQTAIGNYLYTSTTAKKAKPASSGSDAGVFGMATSSGSTAVSAVLFLTPHV